MENSRRYEICNVDVHRAPMQKHLRSKKHLEIIKQDDITKPEWFIKEEQAPIKNKNRKIYNSITIKQIAS